MRIPLRFALALGMAGVLAACTDEPMSAPTGPVVPRAIPSAKSTFNLPATCDANQLKTYARNYASKSNDALLSLIGDIPAALKADGGTPGVASTDKAFDALSRAAAIRGTSMKVDASKANFDLLVRGLLRCTAPAVTAAAVEPPDNSFGGALTPNWVFEVRGKNTTSEAGGAYERGSSDNTWWGAWPKSGTWGDAISSSLTDGKTPTATPLGKRVLIYGYRSETTPVPGKLGSTFQHYSIPKIDNTTFDVTATLGLCFADANQISGAAYLNHDKKFLKLAQPTSQECDVPVGFTGTTSLVLGRMNPLYLARQASRYVWPQPLYAATTMFGGGSVTGTPDDWSPSAVWDLSQFVLPTGPLAMGDGKTSEEIHLLGGASVTFPVTVVGGGPAPDGTPVTVSVVGNQSVIAYFSDNGGTPAPTATRYVTGGTVSFANVNLTKAGGYQLSFQVSFEGFNSKQPLLSTSFNIQNK